MKKFIRIDLLQMQQSMLEYLHKHWKLFFAEGVFFVILGTLAIVIPQIFTLGIILFLGWLFWWAVSFRLLELLVFSICQGLVSGLLSDYYR